MGIHFLLKKINQRVLKEKKIIIKKKKEKKIEEYKKKIRKNNKNKIYFLLNAVRGWEDSFSYLRGGHCNFSNVIGTLCIKDIPWGRSV